MRVRLGRKGRQMVQLGAARRDDFPDRGTFVR
jgi:hypothetical protein